MTRFEAEFDLAFHRRVRDGFLALAAAEPDRFAVVDAASDVGRRGGRSAAPSTGCSLAGWPAVNRNGPGVRIQR